MRYYRTVWAEVQEMVSNCVMGHCRKLVFWAKEEPQGEALERQFTSCWSPTLQPVHLFETVLAIECRHTDSGDKD